MLRNALSYLSMTLLAVFFSPSSFAQYLMSEAKIIEMAKQSSPVNQQIEANQQATNAQQFAVKSQYDPKLQAEYSYFSSREDAIIQFAPVFHPQKTFNLGVNQKTSLGTSVTTSLFSNQISTANGFINNATQVGLQVGVEIDIWKNFLGRLDRSQLNSAKINKKIMDLQSDVDRHGFVLDMRKLYWSLIANELSLQLSEELVKTATLQFNESRQKLKEGLGDSGDVARYQAQLESRKSSALFFAYQKEVLVGQLKSLIPNLDTKVLAFNVSDGAKIETAARRCMGLIASEGEMNTTFSRYDDIVSLLNEQQDHELRLAKSSDSMDLKLKARYQASGVDTSHDAAYDRLTDQFKNGYQVGVALQVPLGGDTARSRVAQVNATQSKFDAQKNKLSMQLTSEHDKVRRALKLLSEASQSQGATVDSLKKSMEKTRKKYKQARVSLNTYILEQDNLFSSELQLIDTKRQILHLLLDYFKLFSNHPCEINNYQGAQS